MGIDQYAAQTFHAETLDESHPAHVGGQVVDLDGAFAGPPTGRRLAQIEAERLDTGHHLVPVRKRFLVDGPDSRETLFLEIADQGSSNESSRAGYQNQIGPVGPRSLRILISLRHSDIIGPPRMTLHRH